MSIHTTIQKILVEADQRLRQAIADAATAGDLEGVDLARNAAGRLRQMIDGLDGSEDDPVKTSGHNSAGPGPSNKPPGRKRQTKKSKFPKYKVRGEYLCRIGWSKKERKEYEHKVARSVFDDTISAMETLAHDLSGPISAEKIIDKVNKLSTEAIPSYQIYVVIGVLRDNRDISQMGRKGYDIPQKLRDKAVARWEKLSGGAK